MEKSRIGEKALLKRTGKTWEEWFRILDQAGGTGMSHSEMARFLRQEYLPEDHWYAQTVAVAYEQERGLRVTHQKVGGFEISVSKTIRSPLELLWECVENPSKRTQWLEASIFIHKATPQKTMRATWTDGQKSLSFSFYKKDPLKCQIVVQHTKLRSAAEAAEKKEYWKTALAKLDSVTAARSG